MSKNWMEAAGQEGIPTAFLVDTKGNIAWIGHPMELKDEVIQNALSGTSQRARARNRTEEGREALLECLGQLVHPRWMNRWTHCLSPVLLAAFSALEQRARLLFRPTRSRAWSAPASRQAAPWSGIANLRSDVASFTASAPSLPQRIQTWRDRGYRIHVMTGVSWGGYQDYLYGRFDGVNHEDEAQTDRHGNKISHGGDVYYMCPGTNYGKYLCQGIQRALDAGAEAIHLEEPEFWVRGGYSEGFKREWRSYYGEEWQPPHSSVDAQWRASKLKYYLYRRALQQVFDYVQDYNRRTGRQVRCYVPTHSLLNYAHWRIVSPESSLARLEGCDGYIAQVWTGTSRTPNMFRGQLRERTFETAFLEYGAMMNLVRATGRRVWFLNDPVEDNPGHDWTDYRVNWESTHGRVAVPARGLALRGGALAGARVRRAVSARKPSPKSASRCRRPTRPKCKPS